MNVRYDFIKGRLRCFIRMGMIFVVYLYEREQCEAVRKGVVTGCRREGAGWDAVGCVVWTCSGVRECGAGTRVEG